MEHGKNSYSESYREAGVDITAGYKAVELMKSHIARTLTSGAMGAVGGFGGAFELDLTGINKPVLISGTDGVGTKLKLAFLFLYLVRVRFVKSHLGNRRVICVILYNVVACYFIV